MRYRQNTKGDILYGPPVTLSKKLDFSKKKSFLCESITKTFWLTKRVFLENPIAFLKEQKTNYQSQFSIF